MMMAGAAWNAKGKRHGKDEVEPDAEMKYMPSPIYADKEYPTANIMPCIETMKPLDSGVETSA